MTPPTDPAPGGQTPPPIPQAELERLFPPTTKPPPAGVFELGLVLGGTVSAGAYTGGVLDFLIEALDAWQRAKDAGSPDAPTHRVVIGNVGGTSGGAVNGAILLRAAGREFRHGTDDANPFHRAWVRGVDLMQLLSPSEDAGGLASILNCRALDRVADETVEWNGGVPLGTSSSPRHRSYLANPLRLFMMVGNVTGIAYAIPMPGESRLDHQLVLHADHVRFALEVPGGVPQEIGSRPDELALGPASANWKTVRDASLATSAFPLALRSRVLERALAVSGYRAIAVPSEDGKAIVQQLLPKWAFLPRKEGKPDVASFANVDGGLFNNEPLDIVRTALAGLDGHNKRSPDEANRAVVLIDPFSDPEILTMPDTGRLTAMIGPLISSMIRQSRFKPLDLALAYQESVYSRFLVAPVRWDRKALRLVLGRKAIASGALGGFLGFVDSRLMGHDYQLGRRNAWSFLKKHFLLPEDSANPLVKSPFWTDIQKERHRHVSEEEHDKGTRYLPIIPLMDDVAEPKEPDWPSPTELPSGFANAVEARLEVVFDEAKAQFLANSRFARLGLTVAWKLYIRDAIRDAIMRTVEQGLVDQGLKPRT